MTTSARALCEALSASRVRLSAPSASLLVASPKERVTPALAALLKRFKPELVGLLRACIRNHQDAAIVACARCDVDFAHASERLCPWCKVTEYNAVEALGCAERGYLARQSAPETTVPTVLNTPKTGVIRTVGQLGHLSY